MIYEIDKRINRALTGIRQAFRGVLTLTASDSGVQFVQADGLAGESLQDMELFQHYGFTSNPQPGTMAVVLPIGGKTSHGIVIATEHGSYRLKSLKPGEVALYTDEGAKVVLKRGRVIETDCDVFRVNCKTWEVNCTDWTVNCSSWKVNASASATFDTPTLMATKQTVVQGLLSSNGGLAASGGGGGSAVTVSGKMSVTQDVVAGGKSLVSHTHRESGGNTTNPPN